VKPGSPLQPPTPRQQVEAQEKEIRQLNEDLDRCVSERVHMQTGLTSEDDLLDDAGSFDSAESRVAHLCVFCKGGDEVAGRKGFPPCNS
jgi:hypothetical protein